MGGGKCESKVEELERAGGENVGGGGGGGGDIFTGGGGEEGGGGGGGGVGILVVRFGLPLLFTEVENDCVVIVFSGDAVGISFTGWDISVKETFEGEVTFFVKVEAGDIGDCNTDETFEEVLILKLDVFKAAPGSFWLFSEVCLLSAVAGLLIFGV